MELFIELHDHEDVVHDEFTYEFESQDTLQQLEDKICSMWKIEIGYQKLFSESGEKIFGLSENSLQSYGLKHGSKVIVKHADLQWWTEYRKCVELVTRQRTGLVELAKKAVQHHERLTESGFFDVYPKFEEFQRQKHSEVASWVDGEDNLMCKATEEYFLNLHDQKRGNEDSEFICYFEDRDVEFEGTSMSTLAFVRIHGEDSVTKYNVKSYHATSSYPVQDVTEFYCYKLLELIGVGPKSHIIPPRSIEAKTNTYIATQWDDNFELLDNVIDENSLCVDVIVQLVMVKKLLFITDLHEQNCGRWNGTKNAAIVGFSPTGDWVLHNSMIKSQMFPPFVDRRWIKEYSAVKDQHDDNSWFKIAKVYFDKWDLSSKIELAHEQLDPTNVLFKSLEISYKAWNINFSPTDELNDFIDTLKKNAGSLQTLLNSIV